MSSKKYPGGLFVSVDGCDGAGKGSQIPRVINWFEERGYNVLSTREPGGTVIGEELRNLLKHTPGDDKATDIAELLMFSAARTQLLHKVIIPHLNKGGVVVADRFHDSTTAYQGYARGIDLDTVYAAHKLAIGNNLPNLTLMFDLDPRISRARAAERERIATILETGKEPPCNFELEPTEFHTKVRNGFLEIARKDPGRVTIIDASQTMEEVAEQIYRVLNNHFG